MEVWALMGTAAGITITALGTVAAAWINSHGGSAQVLRERITLRDEQLADCEQDKAELQAQLDRELARRGVGR